MTDMLRLEGRIEVLDHGEAGKIVIDWALGRRDLPTTIAELEKDLAGIATVPPGRYHELQFVQSGAMVDDKGNPELDENGKPKIDEEGKPKRRLYIRLPERELLQQSLDAAHEFDQRGTGRSTLQSFYGLPRFYEDLYRGTGATETLEELLQSRIGDYTIAHCR
jgi:hypothetical protein